MGKVISLLKYIRNKGRYDGMNVNTLNTTFTTAEIENIAKDALLNYDADNIPVDPIIIANKLNINVYSVNFNMFNNDTVSGAIKKQDGNVSIYVNSSDGILRQRFTIAHELGHYFLHFNNNDSYEVVDMKRKSGYTSNDNAEIEANTFAAALLMQENILREKYIMAAQLGLSKDYIIQMLSEVFAVSKSAMQYRIKNLCL